MMPGNGLEHDDELNDEKDSENIPSGTGVSSVSGSGDHVLVVDYWSLSFLVTMLHLLHLRAGVVLANVCVFIFS